MPDGDYYIGYEEFAKLLMNPNLAVADKRLWDDEAMELALEITQGSIHLELGLDTLTKLTNTVYSAVLKGIQTYLVLQMITMTRISKEGDNLNQTDLQRAFTISPGFTDVQRQQLSRIREDMNSTSLVRNR